MKTELDFLWAFFKSVFECVCHSLSQLCVHICGGWECVFTASSSCSFLHDRAHFSPSRSLPVATPHRPGSDLCSSGGPWCRGVAGVTGDGRGGPQRLLESFSLRRRWSLWYLPGGLGQVEIKSPMCDRWKESELIALERRGAFPLHPPTHPVLFTDLKKPLNQTYLPDKQRGKPVGG